MKNYPFPIPDQKIKAWHSKNNKSWFVVKNEHNLKYRKMFGLDDFRPWRMNEPQMYCEVVKEDNTFHFDGIKLSLIHDKPLEEVLRNIQLSTRCPECIKITEKSWILYRYRLPTHNWNITLNNMVCLGFHQKDVKKVINDFRRGEEYTLYVDLNSKTVNDFIKGVLTSDFK